MNRNSLAKSPRRIKHNLTQFPTSFAEYPCSDGNSKQGGADECFHVVSNQVDVQRGNSRKARARGLHRARLSPAPIAAAARQATRALWGVCSIFHDCSAWASAANQSAWCNFSFA